ncbi:MAG TPA: hypothetical protein VMS88_01735 [Terriglobales bacterium]|nr:hypothetical protein [Terriglobales bacterium]
MRLPAPNTLAIVGAGPVGLEAAAAALDHGFDVHVFEQGEVGSHPIAWGHVRMFTPWSANLGPRARVRLEAAGWTAPDPDARPTGLELAERYLEPLASLPELKERVHTFAQVVAVSRHGLRRDEGDAEERRARPFRLLVRDQGGRENVLHAFSVIDASGVYTNPDWAGTGGIPARSEAYLRPQVSYHVTDVLGLDRDRYAGRRTLVIGGDTCAAIVIADLARLTEEAEGTVACWITREPVDRLGARAGDAIEPRRELWERARALARGAVPAIAHVGGAEVEGFEFNSATHRYRVELTIGAETRVEEADRVVVLAGFAPDPALALRADEPQGFTLGHKACGRDPDFLLETGYRQVERAIARLAAEARAAARA